jgi:hypothetical protein
MARATKRSKGGSRTKVGSFWTDTGLVLVGDPGRLLPDERYPEDEHAPPVKYLKFLEGFRGPEPEVERVELKGGHVIERQGKLEHLDAAPVLDGEDRVGLGVSVCCDGWCHVYLESDDNGPKWIIIEIGKVKP